MIDGFLRFFISRHKLANLILLMVLLVGLKVSFSLKRESWPSIDLGQVNINTIYPGASPEDVEINVTSKIEDELKKVSGIQKMISYSLENISMIRLNLNPNLSADDMFVIKNEIRDAVGRVSDLPQAVKQRPEVRDIKTSIFPVIEVGISGEYPYFVMRSIIEKLEKRLSTISGVSNIEKYGYRDREISLQVDKAKMADYQVSLSDLSYAIKRRNIRATGGSFESYVNEKNVVTLAQFKEPQEVGDVIVKSSFDGPLVKVKDLTVINDGFKKASFMSRMNGIDTVSLSVVKNEDADIIETVAEVKKVVKEFEGYLAPGISINYANDQSKSVESRFKIVLSNGITGFVLVIIMLTMFLNFRAAFWVALGVPFTLLGVISLMPVMGIYLDTMTLSAMIIVLGIVVDDAIVISENINKYMEQGLDPVEAAVIGTKEVLLPVLTTVVTTLCAFAPMFFMSGIMGKYVILIPSVVCLALLISLGESLFLLPAHIANVKKKVKKNNSSAEKKKGFFERLQGKYKNLMMHILRFRYLFVILFVVMFFISMAASKKMNFVLLPDSGADRFIINVEAKSGTSLMATAKAIESVEDILAKYPKQYVSSYITRIGRGLLVQERAENFAMIDVVLTPFGERDKTAADIIEEVRAQTSSIKNFEKINFTIMNGGPPVGKPFSLKVIGYDNKMRKELTDAVESYLEKIDGVSDITRDDKLGKEQIEINIDFEKMARLGLTVADITRTVRIAYDGEDVTSVRYGTENVDFRLMMNRQQKKDIKALGELLVSNKQKRLIPLSKVASFKTLPGASVYAHFKGERATTIEADILQSKTTAYKALVAVYKEFRPKFMTTWKGMSFAVDGAAKETYKSMRSLMVTFVMAGIAIYFVLVLLFDSFLQPLLVIVAIPFGLIGVIFAFLLHGQDFSFMASMGIVGLCGVVVNDSLVLVDHLNTLKKKDTAALKEVVAQGTANRLRAIILTSITTIAGLLPLAYGMGGSDVFMGPMAMALGYGILFATPLTLILIPCLYMVSVDIQNLAGKIFKRNG